MMWLGMGDSGLRLVVAMGMGVERRLDAKTGFRGFTAGKLKYLGR